ncbi:hypothetical protein KFR76_03865 [Corynebacterium diphtheriae]|nr:hypothetical protein KFR76_03865 [Corynebacterium diphtheriae]
MDLDGAQLEKFFPEYLPGAGLEQDAPTLQGSGIAGGNDYTDDVVLSTWDRCGTPVVLRRGWYTPDAKRGKGGPWGYDKIRHKHGIWNLYTINKYFKGLCEARMEGTDRIYETPIYEAVRTNDGKKVGTGRSFELRAVIETTVWVPGGLEPRGVKTMFPLRESNDGSDVVPQWFNMEKNID